MALRTILKYPDPRLREKALPVEVIDDETERLVQDMAETMYAAPGVGLAATQLGVPQRVFVIDIADEEEPSDLHVFINPEILRREGTQRFAEGCLSFPSVTEEVERAEAVTVRAFDAKGRAFELEADGLLAVAIQHENDHLDGVLMIDHLGTLKRKLVHREMLKRKDDD